jgi:phosphohistidine phosphatase
MKTLLILRHAKAENKGKETVATDHPRALTGRGRAEASEVGRRMAAQGVRPNLMVSSDARRAYQTATLAATELPEAAPIQLDPDVYNASLDTLLAVVRRQPDSAECVVLVGHNPGFEDLASALTGQSLALPTGGLACLTFATAAWSAVQEGTSTLAWLAMPSGEQ